MHAARAHKTTPRRTDINTKIEGLFIRVYCPGQDKSHRTRMTPKNKNKNKNKQMKFRRRTRFLPACSCPPCARATHHHDVWCGVLAHQITMPSISPWLDCAWLRFDEMRTVNDRWELTRSPFSNSFGESWRIADPRRTGVPGCCCWGLRGGVRIT